MREAPAETLAHAGPGTEHGTGHAARAPRLRLRLVMLALVGAGVLVAVIASVAVQ